MKDRMPNPRLERTRWLAAFIVVAWASRSSASAFGSYMVQDGTNMHLVETPVERSQSHQRQLGIVQVLPTRKILFNLCARSVQRNQVENIAPAIGRKVIY